MKFRSRFFIDISKKISVITAFSILSVSVLTYASEANDISTIDESEVHEYSSESEKSNIFQTEYSHEEVKEILEDQKEYLDEHKEGVDYAEKQAYFTAENDSDASEIAESYGGELKSFERGIAVVDFDESIDKVISEASQSGNFKAPLQANIILELTDTDLETESDYSDASTQWHHEKISSSTAWNNDIYGEGVTVAILDNGFLTTHEDLADNIVDTYNAYDLTTDVSPLNSSSEKNHGTHVAGIVAASLNNKGGCGVAPKADLMLIKLADSSGNIYSSSLFTGIDYAISNGADVINMSVATDTTDNTFISSVQTAVNTAYAKGIVMVSSAGNSGKNTKFYPAACDHVISVANITSSNKLSSSSNYGDSVDIAAPGSNIYSTYASSTSAYGSMSGTSMASPVVAGVAALVLSSKTSLLNDNSSTRADTVINRILDTSDGVTYSYSSRSITGCVDVASAIYTDSDSSSDSESDNDSESNTTSDNNSGSNTTSDNDSSSDSNNNSTSDNNSKSDNDSSSDNNNSSDADNNSGSDNDSEESVKKAISSNSPYGANSVSGNAGSVSYCIAYYENAPYLGKFYKSAKDLGISVSVDGVEIPTSALRIKVKGTKAAGSSLTVSIKKIAGSSYKSIWKQLKSTLKSQTFSVTQYPMTVSGTAVNSKSSGTTTGQLFVKMNKDKSSVKTAKAIVIYHTASGKEKKGLVKVPKSNIQYDSDSKTITLTGNFNGSCSANSI